MKVMIDFKKGPYAADQSSSHNTSFRSKRNPEIQISNIYQMECSNPGVTNLPKKCNTTTQRSPTNNEPGVQKVHDSPLQIMKINIQTNP